MAGSLSHTIPTTAAPAAPIPVRRVSSGAFKLAKKDEKGW
ncbi:hypothetical protein ALMP_42730 [Streptomyces sp. A012304]|nr:hypothetical protein ALMP_42730 [Streptomyces sp. A012304]